jgi:hypothetical protein
MQDWFTIRQLNNVCQMLRLEDIHVGLAKHNNSISPLQKTKIIQIHPTPTLTSGLDTFFILIAPKQGQ